FAGLRGTFEYLRWLGRHADTQESSNTTVRDELQAALRAIRAYESPLAAQLLDRLRRTPGCRVFGISDPARWDERCPTIAFALSNVAPDRVADQCAARGLAVWSGEFASFELMQRLRRDRLGGVVRAGIAHYTTAAEVEKLANVIAEIAQG